MKLFRISAALVTVAAAMVAHPMGNFSVNHYSHIYLRGSGMELTYVLDIAEIPTFQLFGQWKIDGKDQAALTRKAQENAKEWLANLAVTRDGEGVPLIAKSVTARISEGAGGMPVLRVSIDAAAPVSAGVIAFEDRNFPGRAGWKEIVTGHEASATVTAATSTEKDLSAGLTQYPTDPSITPPQALTARIAWAPVAVVAQRSIERPALVTAAALPEAQPVAPIPATSFTQQQPTASGTVVRGDFLSRLLQRKQLGISIVLIGLLAAFGLGSLHALSPGHGKTIVAAYLVGSRGTLKHAGLLGMVVTFTHTFTVFLLGLGVLLFQQYVVPEKIVPVLGAVSGLSIVAVGLSLLYQRAKALMGHGHHHHHSHAHDHEHAHQHIHAHAGSVGVHSHSHSAVAEMEHDHDHEHGFHTHGGTTHSHMVDGDITPGSLIALGISGGMVPCPSALILMLSAIALGRPALGLMLLIAFSSGLALVLMGVGMIAIYAKQLLPDSKKTSQNPAFRMIPVFSAVVVICLGLAMTAASAGWIQPLRFLS